MGIDIPKVTTHGLIEKSAELLDRLMSTIKSAILVDPYIPFDDLCKAAYCINELESI